MAYNVCAAYKWIATSFPILIFFGNVCVCMSFCLFLRLFTGATAVPAFLPLVRKNRNEVCLSVDWAPKHRVQLKSYYYHWTHSTLAVVDLTQRWRCLGNGRYFHMSTFCIQHSPLCFILPNFSIVRLWCVLILFIIFELTCWEMQIFEESAPQQQWHDENIWKNGEREKWETEFAFILKHFIRK